MKLIDFPQELMQFNEIIKNTITNNSSNIDNAITFSNLSVEEDHKRLIVENKEFKRLMKF